MTTTVESEVHGVNAVLHADKQTVTVADSMGGGITVTRWNAQDAIADYVRRLADLIAEEIVEELGLDDDSEDEDDSDEYYDRDSDD